MRRPSAQDERGGRSGRPHDRNDRRRRLAWVGAGLLALTLAAAIVAIITGGGGSGSGSSTETVISIDPQPALVLSPRPGLVTPMGRRTDAPGGYTYRLVLSRAKVPLGSTSDSLVPYYFTLSGRRGDQPFVIVQRLKLPDSFTATPAIADFSVTPRPDGTAGVTFS